MAEKEEQSAEGRVGVNTTSTALNGLDPKDCVRIFGLYLAGGEGYQGKSKAKGKHGYFASKLDADSTVR